jgi:hypothetical protein
MEKEKMEEAVKGILNSLDKGARLENVTEEEEGFRILITKGTHSDWGTLSRDTLEDFVERGKGGHEVKKILGKVVSKINIAAQKRR